MAIFNSYVSLPEGKTPFIAGHIMSHRFDGLRGLPIHPLQVIPTDEGVQDTAQLMSGTTCLPNGWDLFGDYLWLWLT